MLFRSTSLDPAIKEGKFHVELIRRFFLSGEPLLTTFHIAVLPQGSQVTSVSKHGLSLWTSTFKVETLGPLGEPARYFLKVRK